MGTGRVLLIVLFLTTNGIAPPVKIPVEKAGVSHSHAAILQNVVGDNYVIRRYFRRGGMQAEAVSFTELSVIVIDCG